MSRRPAASVRRSCRHERPAVGPGTGCLELCREKVEVVVEDDGKPFNPLAVAPPNLSDKSRAGGVGLHFVRSLTDDLKYARRDGINQLRLMKKLSE